MKDVELLAPVGSFESLKAASTKWSKCSLPWRKRL